MECFLFTGSAIAILTLGLISGIVLRAQINNNHDKETSDVEEYIWHTIIQRLELIEEKINKRGKCECYEEVSEWDRITDPAIKWNPEIERERRGDTWPEGP